MNRHSLKTRLMGGIAVVALVGSSAQAAKFDIPRSDLAAALDAYQAQSGVAIVVATGAVKDVKTAGVKGDLSAASALSQILKGTGFVADPGLSGVIEIVRGRRKTSEVTSRTIELAQIMQPARAAAAGIESVVVTSSKIKGDIQTVPIAITALSQEQLTSRQIAGGPDLVKEVPNLTFTKTNFSGYSIQIRGIGTQAISVTTDPAVAVAFNDIPFIRNHFFEQEFYDVAQVQILRGPQGTLYGRNATAGVVNVVSAKPTDQFEAMLSADIGNFHNHRFEGMVNIPVVDDRLDIRVAGEWTKRDGYSFNSTTQQAIDGRDLWSARATIGWKPSQNFQAYLIWEHFQESDDRLRSGKQLCKRDPGPDTLNGFPVDDIFQNSPSYRNEFSQGCLPVSLYSPEAFEVPNGFSLPFVAAMIDIGVGEHDPYLSTTQSRNLRVIESAIDPIYKADNDVIEFNADYTITPALTLSSETAFNHDFLYSTEDYNRFNTAPGIFLPTGPAYPYPPVFPKPLFPSRGQVSDSGVFCDPQLGCSDKLVGEDLSTERAWQFSQEFRLSSNFDGPFNFSVGANYLHYETEENYYVFINAISLIAVTREQPMPAYIPGVSQNMECQNGLEVSVYSTLALGCAYIDPNPLSRVNDKGHNYFLSQNPYVLNSYAGFGEVYYNVADDLKLTGGLRWTDDEKHFLLIPSLILNGGWGYPTTGAVNQKWNQWTGRAAANWTPKLDFSDQTLVYGSYAHGYKAGGANPPGAYLLEIGGNLQDTGHPTHPLIFKPEFVDAFELGTKNTFLDGGLTVNGTAFFYDYKGYQISYIVDRTSVNLNFDATVKGAEVEAGWEPVPGLKFNFAGGWEDTTLSKGSQAVDLMDRTAGHSDWTVAKPAITQASNCILPVWVVGLNIPGSGAHTSSPYGYTECGEAYIAHLDPVTNEPFVADPDPVRFPGYPGFDPSTAPNNGEGFFKDLSGKELPNAPHFTTSLSGEYTLPVFENWAATLHGDFYWQSQSFARVFNDVPYDKIRGYSTVNLALILTNADGWQVMLYDKNVFNKTAITGDFLNSDDSGLTTNVFLTDPRLIGVRVTKNW